MIISFFQIESFFILFVFLCELFFVATTATLISFRLVDTHFYLVCNPVPTNKRRWTREEVEEMDPEELGLFQTIVESQKVVPLSH